MTQYDGKTKDQLLDILNKRGKKSGKPMPAIIPINKKGEIRYGTAGMEATGVMAVALPVDGSSCLDEMKRGNWKSAGNKLAYRLNPFKSLTGKVGVVSTLAALFGKGKKVGPGRLT